MAYSPATNTGTGKAFPSRVDNSERGAHRPEPNMLSRKDMEHERWTVQDCLPVRGEPRTDLANRVMFAPSTDGDMERVVRGHEMMHAKVSPTPEQMVQWVERSVASETAMIVVEELRVNYLCETRGFDVKKFLSDGSELATGEHLAKSNDWAGAVAMCIATANTAGHKTFLNGIRRHNREWGESLVAIGKRAVKEMRKAHKERTLASTDTYEGIAPYGFLHTERLAEWVDRLATFPPPPKKPSPKGKAGETGEAKGVDKSEGKEEHHAEYEESKDGDKDGNPHGRISPAPAGGAHGWAELIVSREPMPRHHYGSMGKKRIATNMGRRPRRLHRYMTDPAKRVFDKTVRGSGGMVIIDASGSMSFTTEQIAEIIENAQGATVAIYSDRGRKDMPNMWVVADKGKMVENVEYIDYGHGNGVDFPAIEWGVKNRQYKNTPLVWVTDGGVCGAHDGFSELLSMQCITYARQHNFIVVPHIEEAIQQLRNLKVHGKAHSVYPYMFQRTYQQHMGVPLPEKGE
jgi:hypothetical protein